MTCWKVKAKMKRKIKSKKKIFQKSKNERIVFIRVGHWWKVKAKMKRRIKKNNNKKNGSKIKK